MKKIRGMSAVLILLVLLCLGAASGDPGVRGDSTDVLAEAAGEPVPEEQSPTTTGEQPIQEPSTEVQEPADTQEETQHGETEYGIESADSGLDAAHEAVCTILESGTRDFFKGYPVDEAFLCWVGGTYGQETLKELAASLQAGEERDGIWYEMTGNTMHALWAVYCREHDYATYFWENLVWKEAADPELVTIDLVGDVNLDDRWYTMQTAEAAGGVEECISPDVRQELQSADITVVNNEFTYTTSEEALEDKSYTFKADPENVEDLEVFGTDLVTLANNHTYDYGEQGLLDTLDTLERAGIPYSGAGRNLAEAQAVRYFVVGGRKIAFVCASEIERFYHFTKEAGEQEPGILKAQQEEAVLAAIQEARANSDYVIAYIHWGAEGTVAYDSGQSELARTYVDAGVDAVIGSHPHRLQGVTFVDDVPVAYSLGNFWFSSGTLYTTIAQLQIDGDGELSLRLLPCMQRAGKTYLLDNEEEVKEFYHYLADISSNVGIDESGRFFHYRDVDGPGESPYAYTSGRRYGMHPNGEDLDGRKIDIVGNLE